MRENKYRGRYIETGEWVHGYLIGTDVIVGDIVEFNDEYFNTEYWYKVDPETVGQYTGLKDKNGREIYEGDIVVSFKKQYEHCPTTNKVQFIRGCWRLKAGSMNDAPLYNYDESELEVIGNIYENPELLEV